MENQFENQQIPYYPNQRILTPEESYRMDLKKTAGKNSMLLFILGICGYALSFVCGIAYGLIGMLNSSSPESLDSLLNQPDQLFLIISSTLPIIIVEILLILIARSIFQISLKSLFGKIETKPSVNLLGIVACIAAGSFASLTSALFLKLFENIGIPIPSPDFNVSKEQPVAMIIMFVYVCLIAPILEEIIFRGFIFKSLQKFGSLFAILFSSIGFALFHGNLVQLFPPFLMGIVLGALTMKANSLVPAIIAHSINNIIAMVLANFIPEDAPYADIIGTVYLLAGVIAFIVLVICYWKKVKQYPKEDVTYMKIGKKLQTACSSGWSIGYFIYYAVLVGASILLTLASTLI